jgi:hypothetical protein
MISNEIAKADPKQMMAAAQKSWPWPMHSCDILECYISCNFAKPQFEVEPFGLPKIALGRNKWGEKLNKRKWGLKPLWSWQKCEKLGRQLWWPQLKYSVDYQLKEK